MGKFKTRGKYSPSPVCGMKYLTWTPIMGKFKTQGKVHKYLTWTPVMGKLKTQGNVHSQGVKSIECYESLVGDSSASIINREL